MRKTFLWIVYCLFLIGTVFMQNACSSDVEEMAKSEEKTGPCSMEMQLHVTMNDFDIQKSTRLGDEWIWKDGDVVFIQFKTSKKVISGYAVFTKEVGSWEAYFNGQLDETGNCEIYFFEGVATNNKNTLNLSDANAIYADKSAIYSVVKNEIVLEGKLAPITSRIKFKGIPEESIQVDGIQHYTTYNVATNHFTTSTTSVSRVTGTDGFTAYIYGTFADTDLRELYLKNDDGLVFMKQFSSAAFKIGESGYVNIPTNADHKGWSVVSVSQENEYTLSRNGTTVTFKMILVEKGSFVMGDFNDGNSYANRHNVTITKSYYMAETEVTQGLWYVVMGNTNGSGADYPVSYISHDDCLRFLEKLNEQTGEIFRLPTEAEWEYAAKGGNKSKSYLYSGSSDIQSVAWYKSNSENKVHIVKSLAPNELGLYDMSGNVSEWCSDWFESYSTSDQTDPTGPTTGSTKVVRGGSWFDDASKCRTANRSEETPNYRINNLGLRLALSAVK